MSELREIEDEMRQHPDPVVTVPELADRLDRSTTAVRNDLKLLERDGAVTSKDIGARAVAWWHDDRVTERHVAPADHPDQSDLTEQPVDTPGVEAETHTVESAVALLDLPGQGERQEQRQEAMRGLLMHLRDGGEATAGELRTTSYEHHETGYSDARSWWKNCAGDALGRLRDEGVVTLVDSHDGLWRWDPSN